MVEEAKTMMAMADIDWNVLESPVCETYMWEDRGLLASGNIGSRDYIIRHIAFDVVELLPVNDLYNKSLHEVNCPADPHVALTRYYSAISSCFPHPLCHVVLHPWLWTMHSCLPSSWFLSPAFHPMTYAWHKKNLPSLDPARCMLSLSCSFWCAVLGTCLLFIGAFCSIVRHCYKLNQHNFMTSNVFLQVLQEFGCPTGEWSVIVCVHHS